MLIFAPEGRGESASDKCKPSGTPTAAAGEQHNIFMDTNNYFNETENEEEIDLARQLHACFAAVASRWHWFVVSVILCLAVGWIYQQRKTRIYQRQAVILIEDSDGGSFSSRNRNARNISNKLLELNGVSVGDNLINEMFIITSHRLMKRVVDSLGLDVNYSAQEAFHIVPLYRARPFEVVFAQKARIPQFFEVRIKNSRQVELSAFSYIDETGKKHESNRKITATLGQRVATPVGSLVVEPRKDFLSYPKDNAVRVSHLPVDLCAAAYKAEISASEYDKESSLIVLTCNDDDPKRAADVIRETFEAYKRDVLANKNRVAESTARFIDERIRLIGSELSQVEGSLAGLKKRIGVVDFQTAANSYTTESATARREAIEMETQRSVAQYLKEFMQEQSNVKEPIPVLPGMSGNSLSSQISDYNRMMIERNRMADNSNEQSPLVVNIDKQLTSLRGAILASLDNYVKQLDLQLQSARHTENDLSRIISQAPENEKEALDVVRQQNLKEALYTYLLNKREEVALQLAINETNVRMVEDPLGPSAPIRPRKSIIMGIALLAGLFIPVVLIYLIYIFDRTLNSRHEVEKVTDAPILGELPRWEKCDERSNISSLSNDDPVTESFRMLRYNLEFIQKGSRVLQTTSTTPGQGKTFVARNLAVVLAMRGMRVLVVDADIRKRTLSKNAHNPRGLSNYLADSSLQLNDLITTSVFCKNADLLSAGPLPPNPSELLMSDRLEALVEEARKNYDYLIFDTTPFFSVADAGIVNRVADLTLYVMRIGVQEREFLKDFDKMYRAGKFRNLYLVLNDVTAKNDRYSYGYGYGYGQIGRNSEEKPGGLKGKLAFMKRK